MKSDVRFTNFKHDKEKYYFLFVSELKAYGIGHFFKEAISKAHFIDIDRIECISIAPDVFEQYNYENIIIINKFAQKENRRKNHDEFVKEICESHYINDMVDELLDNQDELLIYMFETSPHMTLNEKKGVTLVGPNKDIVTTLSNKISLYEIFSPIVPMANYSVSNSYVDLIKDAKKIMAKTKHSLFVSLETSAAGANSIIAHKLEDIEKKFSKNKDDIFLVTEFIEHISDPTSLGVVINEEDIYVASVADQRIDGTKFKGSTYPSRMSKRVQQEVIRQTRVAGREMAKRGYRGIFGCDFIVTKDREVFFIETNPRKQGTTMEFCCMLKTQLPKNAPNLPELELYAVTKNLKAPNMVEPDFFNPNLYWSTYNYKIENKLITHGFLPFQGGEMNMFNNIADGKINKEFIILEHIGQDFFVNKGSFLGRIIAVGKNYEAVEDSIEMGKKLIAYTVKEYVDEKTTNEGTK